MIIMMKSIIMLITIIIRIMNMIILTITPRLRFYELVDLYGCDKQVTDA